MNYPRITRIIKSKKENPDVKTIFFEYQVISIPGQFFMVWIPGVDEIPMSISYDNQNIKGITFRRIGDATKALFNFKLGEKIGIRGPYGNGFKINGKKILFVGGGTGIATIVPAFEEAIKKNLSPTILLGVKNKDELFFEKRIKKDNAEIYISTNDGSKGYKGYASDLAKELLIKHNFEAVLTCGPEFMMKKLYEISGNIPFQASLERYMKCGFGICGQCCVGKGLRVCKEGPVFDRKTLKNIKDFGVFKRDSAGRKIKF